MNETEEVKRQFLRHTVATVAYRGGKAISNAPEGFSNFTVNETTRTPGKILSHIGDLFVWALGMAQGDFSWKQAPDLSWAEESQRFFDKLAAFDDYLASDKELKVPVEKLFQGPIADALNHVGQIALLRRMADSPIKGENYFKAEITAGRVGADQSTTRVEFE
jgi:hypothetical protein